MLKDFGEENPARPTLLKALDAMGNLANLINDAMRQKEAAVSLEGLRSIGSLSRSSSAVDVSKRAHWT